MSNTGNWMHIRYQSKLQARKALSKDGRIFGESIMIGVKPCIDKVSYCWCKENNLIYIQCTSLSTNIGGYVTLLHFASYFLKCDLLCCFSADLVIIALNLNYVLNIELSFLTSFCLSFFVCKMEMVPTSEGSYED